MAWGEFFGNPYLWVYLTALFAGSAVGYIFRSRKRKRSPVSGFSLLAASALLCFSLGILLAPGFLSAPLRFPVPSAAWLLFGLILGRLPSAGFPLLLLACVFVYGDLALVLGAETGIPLGGSGVQVSVLRVDEQGGGAVEFRYGGTAQIVKVKTGFIRFQGRSYRVHPAIPWPRTAGAYLRSVVQEGDSGLIELAGSADSAVPFVSAAKNIGFGAGLIETGVVMSPPAAVHFLRTYVLKYSLEAGDKKISLVSLSFPLKTSDTVE